jgi:hypothetical protein
VDARAGRQRGGQLDVARHAPELRPLQVVALDPDAAAHAGGLHLARHPGELDGAVQRARHHEGVLAAELDAGVQRLEVGLAGSALHLDRAVGRVQVEHALHPLDLDRAVDGAGGDAAAPRQLDLELDVSAAEGPAREALARSPQRQPVARAVDLEPTALGADPHLLGVDAPQLDPAGHDLYVQVHVRRHLPGLLQLVGSGCGGMGDGEAEGPRARPQAPSDAAPAPHELSSAPRPPVHHSSCSSISASLR